MPNLSMDTRTVMLNDELQRSRLVREYPTMVFPIDQRIQAIFLLLGYVRIDFRGSVSCRRFADCLRHDLVTVS
jgi:hypothetical protein